MFIVSYQMTVGETSHAVETSRHALELRDTLAKAGASAITVRDEQGRKVSRAELERGHDGQSAPPSQDTAARHAES